MTARKPISLVACMRDLASERLEQSALILAPGKIRRRALVEEREAPAKA